jgi:CDP-diacylglycerol--glycerol-3-phosphate 3-phosphatidyltransferase
VVSSSSEPFGPSALATPANALTLARLVVAPVLAGLVLVVGPAWSLALAWTVVAATDGLDGWVARRQGVTRSGAFLDPLADKVLVLGVLAALAAIGRVWWWLVVVIAAREVAMSVWRSALGVRGVSVPARRSAKAKTAVQDVTVFVALVPFVAGEAWIVNALAGLAAVLALVSFFQYVADGRRRALGASGQAVQAGGEPGGPV